MALALLQKGEKSFEDIVQSMHDAQSLSDKLNESMKGLNRQIDSLGGTGKSTLAILFQPALEPLTAVIGKTNEWTAALGKAALENENVGKAVTYGTAAVGGGAIAYGVGKLFQGGLAGLRVMKGLKGLGGAAAGIATGVAPVFVTNWPGGAAGAAGGMAAGGVAGKIFSRAKTTLGLLASTPLSKLSMFGAGPVPPGMASAR